MRDETLLRERETKRERERKRKKFVSFFIEMVQWGSRSTCTLRKRFSKKFARERKGKEKKKKKK